MKYYDGIRNVTSKCVDGLFCQFTIIGTEDAINEVRAFVRDGNQAILDTGKGIVAGSIDAITHLENLLRPPVKPAPQPIPFSLEAAKAGAPLVTRDGRNARFVAHVPDAAEEHERMVVLIGGEVCLFPETGRDVPDMSMSSDLFMAPKPKRKMYVNLFLDMSAGPGGGVAWGRFSTPESARKAAEQYGSNIIKHAVAAPVDFED